MVKWKVHSRIARSLVASPVVGVPAGLGLASWLLGTMAGDGGGFFVFLGISGVLFGVGAAVTRWVVDGQRIQRAAAEQYRDESDRDHEQFLNDLGRRLQLDGDERTNQQLAVLTRLHRRMRRVGIFDAKISVDIMPDIKDKIEQLYRSCLSSLERSLELRNAAEEMMTESARTRVFDSRESLIAEVGNTIEHLGATIDFLQTSKLEKDGDRNLSNMRQELEYGLDVARRVEDRIQDLERSLQDGRLADQRDGL